METSKELMNTLLPVPVEPAMSRCGICVNSETRMRPMRSLPMARLSLLEFFGALRAVQQIRARQAVGRRAAGNPRLAGEFLRRYAGDFRVQHQNRAGPAILFAGDSVLFILDRGIPAGQLGTERLRGNGCASGNLDGFDTLPHALLVAFLAPGGPARAGPVQHTALGVLAAGSHRLSEPGINSGE